MKKSDPVANKPRVNADEGKPLPAGEGPLAGEPPRLPWRRILALAVVAAVFLVAAYMSPLRQALSHVRDVSESIRALGWMGPAVLTSGVALLVAVGFPRLALCVIAGMALGFWYGLLWAQLGTLVGNYALFLLARWGAHDWARNYLARHSKLHFLGRRPGLAGVILARQVPVPGLLVNLGLGVVAVRHRHFLLGTIIGQLPEAVPFTLIGAGMLEASFARSAGLISLAVAVMVLGWLGLRALLRDKNSTQSKALAA